MKITEIPVYIWVTLGHTINVMRGGLLTHKCYGSFEAVCYGG